VVGRLPTTPTFVLPYKRFATPCLLTRAEDYLQDPAITYRKTVRHERRVIAYTHPPQRAVSKHASEHEYCEEAIVDHSLIWRMVGWLGSLTLVLDQARAMILQRNPESTCHRVDGSVDPHKARSLDRMAKLETARQLLQIIPEWEACFGCRFFPRFATRAGFD
jgi:hypothetical protein